MSEVTFHAGQSGKVVLRDHQIPHVAQISLALARWPAAHDGSDCGTGKTFCAAVIVARLNVKTLVICPKSVVPTWEQVLADAGATNFTVINWEKAWRKLGRKVPWGKGSYFEWTDQWPLYIFDEAHRAQSATTMQGKMLIAATRQCRITKGRILTLSATVANTPLKMKPLGYALGLFELSGWPQWLDQHGCPELTLGPKDKPERQWKERIFLKSKQAEVMAKLNREIYAERGARLKIADIPDFPTTQIDVRLLDGHDKEVQKLSDELKKFYANRTILAGMAEDERAKLTYLRQAMECAKVPALVEMIEDALETSKVAIFCNYSATLDALAAECDKRKWKRGFIRGDQSSTERSMTIGRFQSDQIDVCLANVQAGGVGVSLHSLEKVPRTALLCPTFSAVDLRQCLGRVHRDGGGTSIQHLVYFRGTVEERVAKCVERKLANLDRLNDGELEGIDVQQEIAL